MAMPLLVLSTWPRPKGYWAGKVFEGPLTHGRKYTKEELWENYTYFIKQVVPVAEELGIRIGIHPDDPPVPELGGVPRCIFGNFDGYVRALEIANSPNIGVCLCCGTWMEGGQGHGQGCVRSCARFRQDGQAVEDSFPQCQQLQFRISSRPSSTTATPTCGS